MKWKKTAAIIASAIFLLTACTKGEDHSAEQEEELITPVETVQVEKGTLNINQTFYGRITPEMIAQVIPPRSGEISELNVENGDEVEEGDVLARVTPGNLAVEAPIDGYIQELTVKEDSLVSQENPIASIVALDPINVSFSVTADQLELFEKDQEINLVVSAVNTEATATVDSISLTTDDTGLYPITASLNNEEQNIKPGMVADISITTEMIEDELIIPTEALIEDGDTTYVYVIKDNVAERTEVEVLATQTESSAIKGELKKDTEVVTKGQLTLTDGSKVEVMKGDE
ncbi:efflux RND transporter periplasmic adaptor subunit [Salinibacillus xinjiangensis]|uniref:Efflux RND transporter periplasmic adaptor subunit n=1 Tax=Salinibacillus xinjiangensis TaxID=1229268 RepID=A0A6G1X282_9BACI|nr:efflux RND transporter periplasmic adaptor subunit [Salinibacillus xinjiangensis]MRG85093.1 efflux RND transporter periplasmic adaptor subunit [Salinibacillus xinjiangensis]